MRLALAILIVLLGLRLLATFQPTPWLWGLDSLADRPRVVQILGVALFAIALIPIAGRAVIAALERISRSLPKWFLLIIGLLGTIAFLWALRSRNILLGDTLLYVSMIDRGVQAAGGAHREPLAQAIVIGFHNGFGKSIGWGATGTFTLVGLILGSVFVGVAARLTGTLSRSTTTRAVLFSALALGGVLQLFAGYAEFYSFAVVGAVGFAWTGLRAIEDSKWTIPAALCFAFAALSHAQVLFAAPAILYLLFILWKEKKHLQLLIIVVGIPLATLGILTLLRYPFAELAQEASRGGNLLPPVGRVMERTAYSAISFHHLCDLANVALLVSPVLPILLFLGLRPSRLPRKTERFFGALAIGPLLFAMFANPQLGMIRDWDILVLPVSLGVLWIAARAVARIDGKRRAEQALAGAVLLTCLAHMTFWVSANHDPTASRERIRRVAAEADFFGSASLSEVWRYIGGAERADGALERSIESFTNSVRAYPKKRMPYRLLALSLLEQAGRRGEPLDAGLRRYHQLIDQGNSRKSYAHHGACFAALTAGRSDLAYLEARKMVQAEPDHPELVATWGDVLRGNGNDAGARAAYERALERDPDHPRARIGMACLAGIAGDRATMESLTAEQLSRTPWSPLAQQFARILRENRSLGPDRIRLFLYIQ